MLYLSWKFEAYICLVLGHSFMLSLRASLHICLQSWYVQYSYNFMALLVEVVFLLRENYSNQLL
jgi:hypothetical protein